MMTAMNGIARDIHGQVDSFVRTNARSASTAWLDAVVIANRVTQVLPKVSQEAPSVFVGRTSDHRTPLHP
jgi:hypothetical protein